MKVGDKKLKLLLSLILSLILAACSNEENGQDLNQTETQAQGGSGAVYSGSGNSSQGSSFTYSVTLEEKESTQKSSFSLTQDSDLIYLKLNCLSKGQFYVYTGSESFSLDMGDSCAAGLEKFTLNEELFIREALSDYYVGEKSSRRLKLNYNNSVGLSNNADSSQRKVVTGPGSLVFTYQEVSRIISETKDVDSSILKTKEAESTSSVKQLLAPQFDIIALKNINSGRDDALQIETLDLLVQILSDSDKDASLSFYICKDQASTDCSSAQTFSELSRVDVVKEKNMEFLFWRIKLIF